jgi:hypothetical protein
MVDVLTWAPILAGLGSLVAIVRFWTEFSEKITITRAEAAAVKAENASLKTAIDSHALQIAAMNASFGLHREQIARDYINRDTLREAESRITAAIERLGDRLDSLFESRNPGSR